MGMDNAVPENSLVASLSESEQRDLFGEPVVQHSGKRLPSKNSNVRRERFVREYVLCGNATKAAQRAGYGKDKEAAKKYGSWLLTQPDVQECLSHFTGVLSARDLVRAEEIVEAAWETFHNVADSRREPLLVLLARLGGLLDSEKVQVQNVLSLPSLVVEDAAKFSGNESGDFSRPCEGAGETGSAGGADV